VSLLVVMGSGETAPSLVKVHREVDLATRGDGPAVLLDTTFGFQVNADDLVERTAAYFKASVGLPVELASWRRADAPQVDRERTLALLGRARWAFAGPGSPTYTLRQWRDTPVPAVLADIPARGGTLVFGSAAACTLGTHAIPVYEVYKAGADPYWEEGLDLFGRLTGLRAVVVPHYDNAEGGRYDTRFCYLGEERLAALEEQLPDDVGVLGVDEHTALVTDLGARLARVSGSGGVTVRRRGAQRVFPAGSRIELDELDALLRGVGGPAGQVTDADRAAPAAIPAAARGAGARPSLRADADAARAAFEAAIGRGDADECVAAVLDLEEAIVAWRTDTDQNDDVDHARRVLRSLVVRLGELATVGVRDPREVVGPYVEALLELRARARAARDYAASDLVRDRLVAAGVEVRDTPEGAQWALAEH
jgi:cyanophycinase-like exopeptidase